MIKKIDYFYILYNFILNLLMIYKHFCTIVILHRILYFLYNFVQIKDLRIK